MNAEEFQVSKLHIYSYGTVAENKPLDTDVAKITPDESLLMLDGEVTSHAAVTETKGKNVDGSAYTEKSVTSNVLEAKWLPFVDGQRVTSPDVRRGERVAIYQFGNDPNYYWTTLGLDLKLRKLETVIYVFSGTRNETDGISPETHYFFEVSTHKKVVHFHTSQADSEPFGYDIQLDTARGVFVLTDSIGNHIELNSPERRLYFCNNHDTSIELIRNDLNANVPGNTTVNTTGNTVVNSGGNTTIKTEGDATIETAGTNLVKGAQNVITGPVTMSVGTGGGQNTVDFLHVQHLVVDNPIDAPGINGWANSLGGG